jgi:hypothetical protein
MHHDHCLGPAERRCWRLLEGAVERRLQCRIGGLHHGRPGNLGKRRRRLRLQRFDIALQDIRLFLSMLLDAAKPVVKRRAATK